MLLAAHVEAPYELPAKALGDPLVPRVIMAMPQSTMGMPYIQWACDSSGPTRVTQSLPVVGFSLMVVIKR